MMFLYRAHVRMRWSYKEYSVVYILPCGKYLLNVMHGPVIKVQINETFFENTCFNVMNNAI